MRLKVLTLPLWLLRRGVLGFLLHRLPNRFVADETLCGGLLLTRLEETRVTFRNLVGWLYVAHYLPSVCLLALTANT